MNVLMISTPDSWRGGERQAAFLSEELRKMALNITVLCPVHSPLAEYWKKKSVEGIPVSPTQRLPHLSGSDEWIEVIYFTKPHLLSLQFGRKIKSICKRKKIDLIHVHDAHAHTYAFLSAWIFGNKTPLVVSRRVDFPVRNSRMSHMKYNHSSVKKIICVSEKIKKITGKSIKDKGKLDVVYSGIDTDVFNNRQSKNILHRELNLSPDIKLIGNFSALAEHKDYFTFIDAAKILSEKNDKLRFIIAGDGPLKEEVKSYCEKQGMKDMVYFIGFRKDVSEILPELDIFLMTSKTEGLGTTLLDAFACRIPVVTTDAGGITEFAKHEFNSLVAPVQNAGLLARHVIRILDDVMLRTRLIINACETAKKFSKKTMAEKTLQIYTEVLTERKVKSIVRCQEPGVIK
jgi:glycosyltransferase involved in cell wall biosynthesis